MGMGGGRDKVVEGGEVEERKDMMVEEISFYHLSL